MLGPHAKVAGTDVFEGRSFAPNEMLLPRQCAPDVRRILGESLRSHKASHLIARCSRAFAGRCACRYSKKPARLQRSFYPTRLK
jgi:hypothetical protein